MTKYVRPRNVKRLLIVLRKALSIPTYISPFKKNNPGRIKFNMDSLKAAIMPKIKDKSFIQIAAVTMLPRKQKTTL